MSPAPVRAVVFDLDGTLVDSRRDLAEAVNRARADLGLPPLAVRDVLGMVGEGARNLVRRALGGAPAPDLFARGYDAFLAHYDDVCLDTTRPYPGIDELVARLAERLPLAVLTNKPQGFSRRIVERCGWRDRFRVVIGGDTLATRKPHPEGLAAAARALGVEPTATLMVGDSAIDAATARAAGAPLVLVGWGYVRDADRAELASARWVADAGELGAVVEELSRPSGTR